MSTPLAEHVEVGAEFVEVGAFRDGFGLGFPIDESGVVETWQVNVGKFDTGGVGPVVRPRLFRYELPHGTTVSLGEVHEDLTPGRMAEYFEYLIQGDALLGVAIVENGHGSLGFVVERGRLLVWFHTDHLGTRLSRIAIVFTIIKNRIAKKVNPK